MLLLASFTSQAGISISIRTVTPTSLNSIGGGGVTCQWGPLCLGTGQVILTSGSSAAWPHAGPHLQGQFLVGMSGREKDGKRVQTSLPLTLAGPRVLPRLQRAEELALVRWGAAGWLDATPCWSRGWVSPGQLPGFTGCVSADTHSWLPP